jgi:D-tyrosyl-tRNA(Tyr) deacylase
MRAVVQRVSSARVTVANRETGRIGSGLLILLGIANGDTPEDVDWLVAKIAALRIFTDAEERLNLSIRDVGDQALVVSQFTLIASTRKGTRPSFNDAAKPAEAIPLYERFVSQLAAAIGRPVPTGEFGASMQVELVNDGPVTLILDSRMRE